MKDLLERYTFHQVVGLVASEGIHYLGTVSIRDGVAMKAFGREKTIWVTADDYHPQNWEEIWDNVLMKARSSTPHGTHLIAPFFRLILRT